MTPTKSISAKLEALTICKWCGKTKDKHSPARHHCPHGFGYHPTRTFNPSGILPKL